MRLKSLSTVQSVRSWRSAVGAMSKSGSGTLCPFLASSCPGPDHHYRSLGGVPDPSTKILDCLLASSGGEKRRTTGTSDSAAVSTTICRAGCCADEAGEARGETGSKKSVINLYTGDDTDLARVIHDGRIGEE